MHKKNIILLLALTLLSQTPALSQRIEKEMRNSTDTVQVAKANDLGKITEKSYEEWLETVKEINMLKNFCLNYDLNADLHFLFGLINFDAGLEVYDVRYERRLTDEEDVIEGRLWTSMHDLQFEKKKNLTTGQETFTEYEKGLPWAVYEKKEGYWELQLEKSPEEVKKKLEKTGRKTFITPYDEFLEEARSLLFLELPDSTVHFFTAVEEADIDLNIQKEGNFYMIRPLSDNVGLEGIKTGYIKAVMKDGYLVPIEFQVKGKYSGIIPYTATMILQSK